MLDYVAVRHPQSWVGDLEQDVHSLPDSQQHGVLPHQIGFLLSVQGEDQEAACPVDVQCPGQGGPSGKVVSRVCVFENSTGDDGEMWATNTHECVAQGVSPQISNPVLQALPYKDPCDRAVPLPADAGAARPSLGSPRI